MQRLVPIAFRDLFPAEEIWVALSELSNFFCELCSRTLNVERLEHLQSNIPKILFKLEQILPPNLFDCMEHLPIHLPYEALLAGPVQYWWMYPFER